MIKLLIIKPNNDIIISKGDTVVIGFQLDMPLYDDDKLTFTISNGGEELFAQDLDSNVLELDASTLPTGTFQYDLRLTYTSGETHHLMFPANFVVKEVC